MIINLKSETDLSGFYVVYEGSTNLEKKGWWGLSHLMEHLMCKNFDHLQEDFDKDGIDWNAYTSGSEICFYLTGLDEKVNKCFAERGVGNTYSFTCVPCDSLVMAEINKTKQNENKQKIFTRITQKW